MKTKILLVDDDSAVLSALTGALESEGFDVRHALNGHEAITVFHTHPDIQLVLLDLNLPVKDGWAALKMIQSARPHLPVIIITGEPGQYFAAISAGAITLLEKPLEIPLLIESIRGVLMGAEESLAAGGGDR